jgi:hypothetical protein
MNEEEYRREQTRQKDMVDGIAREYSRREKEKVLERLSQSLDELEKIVKDLAEETKVLKNWLRFCRTVNPI